MKNIQKNEISLKKYLILFLFVPIGFSCFGQSYNHNYIDGIIYLKFNNTHVFIDETTTCDYQNLPINNIEILRKLNANYPILKAEIPFFRSQDNTLMKIVRVHFQNYEKADEIVKYLKNFKEIEYAEKAVLRKTLYIPNDPYYNLVSGTYNWNWHLDQIGATQAWNISTGNSNIKVAIIDNAIYTDHPEFAGKIYAKWDAADNDNITSPPSTTYGWSHGTHGAGLICAGLNNNIGVSSIGGNVSLIAVKAANSSGQLVGTWDGFEWAVNQGANVVNMSFGSVGDYSATEQNLMTWAHDVKNCVLIAAAGNDNNESIYYPAGYTNVISVAALNGDNTKYSYSCYGSWIDISAPGGGETASGIPLLSTVAHEASASPSGNLTNLFGISGKYDLMRGTSMAAPMVAGLAALLLSINPALSPAQVENCLRSTATNVNSVNSSYQNKLGSGCINAYQAALCAQSAISGIDPIENNDFKLFPNPASETLNLQIPDGVKNGSVSIYDITGKLVLQQHISSIENYNIINISNFSKGLYLLRITTENGHFKTRSFIKE